VWLHFAAISGTFWAVWECNLYEFVNNETNLSIGNSPCVPFGSAFRLIKGWLSPCAQLFSNNLWLVPIKHYVTFKSHMW
jgi:hypothetical protein